VKDVPWAHFTIELGVPGDARGVSQFASFPQADAINHEYNWNEIDGRTIALGNPANNDVFNGRDTSRMHYQFAQEATKGHVYPIMRSDELTLTNAWSQATGGAAEYMAKTLRLLGFNQVNTAQDDVQNSERYGWLRGTAFGSPGDLPFDEEATKKKMDADYRTAFAGIKAPEKVAYAQLADEPIEANTSEYSAPMWRFYNGDEQIPVANDGKVTLEQVKSAPKPAQGAKSALTDRLNFRDVTGSSDLNTAKVDLQDCVFEGDFMGGWVGFRAGIDDAQNPTKGVYWRIGDLDPHTDLNVNYGKMGDPKGASFIAKAAVLSQTAPTPFKIVFEAGQASLFINKVEIYKFERIAEKGGFSVFGPRKTLYSLRLRKIRANEHIDINAPGVLADELDAVNVGTDIKLNANDFDLTPPQREQTPEEFKTFLTTGMVQAGGFPEAQAGFRKWAAAKGLTPDLFGRKSWNEVNMLTVQSLIENRSDRRRYYWSRRYSNWLTPHMYGLAAEAIHRYSPNKNMKEFVALSGHSLYMHNEFLPMDLMQLAAEGKSLMAGVSDWMYVGGWSWDSMQSVAYSVAPMNAGARRYGADWGQEPISYPMMHQVGPEVFRSFTMLSNQVKHISYWTYGPNYAVTEGSWSDGPQQHVNASRVMNRISQVDDILPKARMRPSRVAMLFSMSNEAWDPTSSYSDKRAAFLSLSHEYYQPELVSEEQITAGALQHYDALYILDTAVSTATQDKIAQWVKGGGLLWACAGSASLNEYGEPLDLLAKLAGLSRTFGKETRPYKLTAEQNAIFGGEKPDDYITPEAGESVLRGQSAFRRGKLAGVKWEGAKMRAHYSDGVLAFGEKAVEKGKVFYLGHRAGITYSRTALNGGFNTIWTDAPRKLLTRPLLEAKVDREVLISEPTIMTNPMSTQGGTVLLLINMKPVASTNVKIGLKEPAKPLSVQWFAPDSMELTDLLCEYKDGRAWFTLPSLESLGNGTIVRVRRTPVPADSRKEELRAHTGEQLKSTDPRTLSAGLWFAGLNSQWKFDDKIEPFLANDAWEVRMAATEALWRLDRKASLPRIATAYNLELDRHVKSEMLYALVRLGHEGVQALCLKALADPQDYTRRQAMRGVVELIREGTKNRATPSAALKAFAASAAELGHYYKIPNDAWGTGLGWKEQVMALLDPKAIVDEAAAVFADITKSDPRSLWGNDRDLFASAIAASDALFNEYIKRTALGNSALGDPNLVIEIARRRRSPELAQALGEIMDKVNDAQSYPYVLALKTQHDKTLSHQLFQKRNAVPKIVRAGLPSVLEVTFATGLGPVVSDWDAWFKAHPVKN